MKYIKTKICLTKENLELIELIKNKMGFNSRSEAINYMLENFSSTNNIKDKVKNLTDKYINLLNEKQKDNSIKKINDNFNLVKDLCNNKEVKLEIDKEILVLDYSDTKRIDK